MKKTTITLLSIGLAGVIGLGGLIIPNISRNKGLVIKVANWAEYIDEGDDETSSMVEDFEDWYYQTYGEKVTVEYTTVADNETLYQQIQMGEIYDIACPSEYMIMKLASEGRLQRLPKTFFATTGEDSEHNYYAKHVSTYISDTLKENAIDTKNPASGTWGDYTAGYMWGVTGFAYNPELALEEDVKYWDVFLNETYKGKITAKNNVRDSYFVGLAIHYKDELQKAQDTYEASEKTETDKSAYKQRLKELLNDTEQSTIQQVSPKLKALKRNLYGFETDEGKNEMLKGTISINYQWSGDAAFIIDEAESDEDTPKQFNFAVPELASNLWFDGWVLMEGVEGKKRDAALAFVNFLSMPENAVRNMDYIGYTSCIGAQEVFDYIYAEHDTRYVPEEEEGEVETVESETPIITTTYDLNYFFNPNYKTEKSDDFVLLTDVKNTKRKLFAQFPDEGTLLRCVTMNCFDSEATKYTTKMWQDVLAL